MFTKNAIQLTGNVAAAPETRVVGETTVTRARLMHNETVKKASGEMMERLVVIDLDIWGKRGEAFAKHVTSKVPVFVEGRLQYERWEKDGQARSRLLLRVVDWQFLAVKGAGAGETQKGEQRGEQTGEQKGEQKGGRKVA